jgi:hypothetical protein
VLPVVMTIICGPRAGVSNPERRRNRNFRDGGETKSWNRNEEGEEAEFGMRGIF